MPDNDPVNNAPHLQQRLAVSGGSHAPRAGHHEISSAAELERHIGDGDLGAVRRLLHEAEHRLGPFRPDPWALLGHLAERAVRLQQKLDSARETAPPVQDQNKCESEGA